MAKLTTRQVEKLADEVRAKILAKAAMVSESEGKITVEIYRKGPGFDIRVNVTY
jgi:hypothetical protein